MNVIVIEADQLSAKWLACYGAPAASTPNLDALAAQGVRFTNCVINHPVCMPSRASTMTGRSAQHHGVFYNGWELGPEAHTFPRVLQQAGVQTLGVGKFHLECHGRSAYNDVRKYGFDRAEVTEDIRAGDWLDWVEREHPDCFTAALATVWPLPHLEHYGPRDRNLLAEIRAARQSFPLRISAHEAVPTPIPEKACQTHWVVDRALALLRERDERRPFFLKVSFVDPHDPYDPPPRFLDLIAEPRVPTPVRSGDANLSHVLARFGVVPFVAQFRGTTEADWRRLRRHYLASTAFVDEQVGRLLKYLTRSGLDRDTAVVFTSDHGDMLGDHGLPTKGAWHFDACFRVPLLVRAPGLVAGRIEAQMVNNLDLFPTVLDLAGVPCQVPVEGRSLLPLLRDTGSLDRPQAALVESYGSYANQDLALRARTVVTPAARLTLFGDGAGMLFDLRHDPDETTNLFGRPAAASLTAELKDLLLDLLARQNNPLPSRNRHPFAQH